MDKIAKTNLGVGSQPPEGHYVAACGHIRLVMKAYFDKIESNGISVMAAVLLVDNHV
ncbi:ShET2/EspL2 family type III secretion system effector toxin [Escherichia coli]